MTEPHNTKRQKLFIGIFVVGAGWFCYQLADLFADHSTWAEVSTPASIAELLKTLGAACMAMGGALGVRMAALKALLSGDDEPVRDVPVEKR